MIEHHLHIFLSSPDDVRYERNLAREMIGRIHSEDLYRNILKLEVWAWEKPGISASMPAHLDPKEAIDQALRKPAECDFVIVLCGYKMGTPLSTRYPKPDGNRYLSGTEYEYLDAITAAKKNGVPTVLLYRKAGAPDVNAADPEREEKLKQWDLVEDFFAGFKNLDGSYQHMLPREYSTPTDFKELLEQDLRKYLTPYVVPHRTEKDAQPRKSEAPAWDPSKSPFPGLRAFKPDEALIFYGQGRETDLLIEHLNDPCNRLVAVVGASGSGKSSLVAAGLLPALEKNAIRGSQDWIWLRFTPGEFGTSGEVVGNPFMALAMALKPILAKYGPQPRDVAADLMENLDVFHELISMVLEGQPKWAEVLLFIDQFEELFTLVDAKYQRAFVALLALAEKTPRVRTIVTLRADFYHRCLEWDVLNELVVNHFPLLPPKLGALHEMVTKPAERAGLRFEDELAQKILDNTGTEPGALALMAFALWELWMSLKGANSLLTHAAYNSFKGVHGAIGRRAEDTFNSIKGKKTVLEAAFGRVFRELVEVDEGGVAIRRRARLSQFADGNAAETLVSALTEARLLVAGRGVDHEPMVEVAHEAIFTSWPRVKAWIEATGDDLRLRRQVKQATAVWVADELKKKYLWSDERVVDVVGMLARLGLKLDQLSDSERHFLGPIDIEDMLAKLDEPSATHEQRATIGVRLSLLGDPRPGVGLRADDLPDIAWCEVPGGEITLEMERSGKLSRFLRGSKSKTFRVEPFYIAKYPVTYVQYKAFREADDGFKDSNWWEGLLLQVEEEHRQFNQRDNHPAENLCWLEAVAFCRWLTVKLGYDVRLPTEWEWQQAATGGNPENEYPWGAAWNSSYANTYESGLNRSTAVGIYPHGVSPVGALDMSGGVWELCLNGYDNPLRVGETGEASRVVRGGSWNCSKVDARAAFREYLDLFPDYRFYDVGFRVCCVSPIL